MLTFHRLPRLVASLIMVAGLAGATPVFAVGSDSGNGGGGSSSDSSGGGGGGSSSGDQSSGPALADAKALVKAEKWAPAIKLLKQIIANGSSADAYNYLGFSYRMSGDMDNWLKAYVKALKINPKHKGANEYLGELYVQTGHMDKAMEQLATLAAICGNTTCEEYEDLEKAIGSKS